MLIRIEQQYISENKPYEEGTKVLVKPYNKPTVEAIISGYKVLFNGKLKPTLSRITKSGKASKIDPYNFIDFKIQKVIQ